MRRFPIEAILFRLAPMKVLFIVGTLLVETGCNLSMFSMRPSLSNVDGQSSYLPGGPTHASPTLVTLKVTLPSVSLAQGLTESATAVGVYSNGSSQNLTQQVTWITSSTVIATVSDSGSLLAVGQGTTEISARMGSVVSSTQSLTVTAPLLTTLAVNPASMSLTVGASQSFAALGTYSDGTTQNLTSSVSWVSSEPNVATIDGTGSVSALAIGSTSVTAELGGVSSPAATLMVTAAALVSIAVTPASASIAKGLTQAFQAVGTYSDNSTLNLTSAVHWSSSNSNVASVNASGVATGKGQGQTTVSAQMGTVSSSDASLSVTAAVLQSIAISPPSASLAQGTTKQFSIVGTYSDGTTQTLNSGMSWSSSNSATVSVTGAGLATGASQGSATLTATADSFSASASVTVNPAPNPTFYSIPGDVAGFNSLPDNGIAALSVQGSQIVARTGNGLAISEDGGMTFRTVTARKTGIGQSSIWADSLYVNGNQIITSSFGGVAVSNDQGKTWQSKYIDWAGAVGVVGSHIYVSGSDANSIYRSDDSGQTWAPAQLEVSPATYSTFGRLRAVGTTILIQQQDSNSISTPPTQNSMAIRPGQSQNVPPLITPAGTTRTPFSCTSTSDPSVATVTTTSSDVCVVSAIAPGTTTFQAEFADQTWTTVTVYVTLPFVAMLKSPDGISGWSYVPTPDSFLQFDAKGSCFYAFSSKQIYLSADGGTTFTTASFPPGFSPNPNPNGPPRITGSGSNTLALVSGNSGYYSLDAGQTWISITLGPVPHQITDLEIVGQTLYVASDLGIYETEMTSNGGTAGGGTLIHGASTTPPALVDKVRGSGALLALLTESGVYVSTDHGLSWPGSYLPNNTISLPTDVSVDGNTVYTAAQDGVRASTDSGATWNLLTKVNAAPWGAATRPTQLLVTGGTLYVATYDGLVLSSDGGKTWAQPAANSPYLGTSSKLSGGIAFAGSGNAVGILTSIALCITTNRGADWNCQPLPNGGTGYTNWDNSLGFAMGNGKVYIAAYNGLLVSNDMGATWEEPRALSEFAGVEAASLQWVNGALYFAGVRSISLPGVAAFSSDDGVTWTDYTLGQGLPSPTYSDIWSDGVSVYLCGGYGSGGGGGNGLSVINPQFSVSP